MKRLVLALSFVLMFASNSWAPPTGGVGSRGTVRNMQDLRDVAKPLAPANGEGLLYSDTDTNFFATDIATQIELDAVETADDSAFYDSSETAIFSDLKVKGPWIDVRAYGAGTAVSGTNNSAYIQSAIDYANSVGGGNVLIPGDGTYTIRVQGNHPTYSGHKYAIRVKDNVNLIIENGATLSLGSGEQVDGAPVDIIVVADSDNVYIGGGGAVTGNTSGQAGWTGGYAQESGGTIINVYDSATPGSDNVTIENLVLYDHFANAIMVHGKTGRMTNLKINNIWAYDCGEGPLIINADGVFIDNVHYSDTSDVAVGDGIEVSNVDNFHISNSSASNNGAGAGFDLYGSSNGVLDNFVVNQWYGGVSIGYSPTSTVTEQTDNIVVSNGVIYAVGNSSGGTGIVFSANSTTATYGRNVNISNVVIDNPTAGGIGMGDDSGIIEGPVTINGVAVYGATNGLDITQAKNMTVTNSQFSYNSSNGIRWVADSDVTSDEITGWNFNNIVATGNSSYGFALDTQGLTPKPTGVIQNCDFTGNDTGALDYLNAPGGYANFDSLIVTNIKPDRVTGGNGTHVMGLRYLQPNATLSRFGGATDGQLITIIFPDNNRTVNDLNDGGVEFNLIGDTNFNGSTGDRLTLSYNKTDQQWYEVSRASLDGFYRDFHTDIFVGSDTNTLLGVDVMNTGGLTTTGGGANGLYNTAIGNLAMRDATTANYNTAIGYQAGRTMSTTSGSIAIGAGAMSSSNGGDQNVAIGLNALQSVQNGGAYNMCVGTNSCQKVTTGDYNTGIGFDSVQNLVTGGNNIGIGAFSYRYGLGSGNVSIGYSAMGAITSGDYNTVIGYQAGDGLNSAANNNVIIGYDMEASGSSVTDNSLNIGSNGTSAVAASTIGTDLHLYGSVVYGTAEITFDATDTTPTIAGGNMFACNSTSTATTVTDFNDGIAGQEIIVRAVSDTTDFTDGGNLSLAGNWTPDAGDILRIYTPDGTNWYEISRSAN